MPLFAVPERVLETEAMQTQAEVAAYDKLVRQYSKILHDGFVQTIKNFTPPSGSFLEVGTGTGWISIGVAQTLPNARITAIDLSEDMLEVAKANAADANVLDRIEFMKGDAKSTPFEDGHFDVVYSHNMMHHIPDPISMAMEMKRVLKPDGAFLLRDLVRLSSLECFLHVNLFGFKYDQRMKTQYRDSIRASLSAKEWQILLEQLDLPNASLSRQFITHMSILRSSSSMGEADSNTAKSSKSSFLQDLYVSKKV